MSKRNYDKYTPAADAKQNILRFLRVHYPDWRRGAMKSSVGRAAFPEYDFRRPQGAAFAVAKLVREMEKDGLVGYSLSGHGIYITEKGIEAIQNREVA